MRKGFVKGYQANHEGVIADLIIFDEREKSSKVVVMVNYKPLTGYQITTEVHDALLNTHIIPGNYFTVENLKNEIIHQLKDARVFEEPLEQFFSDLAERIFESAKFIDRKVGSKYPLEELKAEQAASRIPRHTLTINTADSKWNQPLTNETKTDLIEKKGNKMKVEFRIENISIDNANQVAEWLITPVVNDDDQNDKAVVFKSAWVSKPTDGEAGAFVINQLDDGQMFRRGDETQLGEFLTKSYDAENLSLDEVKLDITNLEIILENIINTHEIAARVVDYNKALGEEVPAQPVEDITDATLGRRANYEVAEAHTAPFGEVRGATLNVPTGKPTQSKAECANLIVEGVGRVRFCIGDGKLNQLSVIITDELGGEVSHYTENHFVDEDIINNIEKVERITHQVLTTNPLADEDEYIQVFFLLSILVGKYHEHLATLKV